MKTKTAFEKQLLSLQDNMLNFALTLTADREEAKDLLQETTLRVLDNREKYYENVNFKGGYLPSCIIFLSIITEK